MADGYDRFENEGSGGGSFVMGLLTGTVLGAGLGMLFAPKAGSELRGQLSEQAGNLANTASEGYRKARRERGPVGADWKGAGEWAERGKDVYDKARDAVKRGADEAQRYVRDASRRRDRRPAVRRRVRPARRRPRAPATVRRPSQFGTSEPPAGGPRRS